MERDGWEASKRRFEALWNNERADRCTVSMSCLKDPSIPLTYRRNKKEADPAYLKRFFLDEEFICGALREMLDRTLYFGDAFPTAGPCLGVCGQSGYTNKCAYHLQPYTVWFDPVMEDISEPLTFDPDSDLYKAMLRIYKHLGDCPERDFLLWNSDNCSSLDALANLRGSGELLVDMLEEPDAVLRQQAVLQSILKTTERAFDKLIQRVNGGGTVTQWMQLWSPGYHHQLQCDLSVMISPALFERFVYPELEENARWMGQVVYHLDGMEQIRHLDMILSIPNIQLIQWTPVAGQPPTTAFIDVLQRIQKAGKGLVLIPFAHEMPALLSALEPKGVHYAVWGLSSPQEGAEILEMVERACRKKTLF